MTKAKMVKLNPATHRHAKILAAEEGRNLNGDLIDDLVMLGIDAFRRIVGREEKTEEGKEAKEEAR